MGVGATTRLALAAGLSFGLAGCFSEGDEFRQLAVATPPPGGRPAPVESPAEVFPLVPGARYDYAASFGLGGGQFSGTASLSVLDAWQTPSGLVTHVGLVSSYLGRTRHDMYAFRRARGWIGMFEKWPPDTVTDFLPVAFSGGDRWAVRTGEGTGSAWLDGREDLVVPAGRYAACYRVRYQNPANATDITFWFAPYVGLVKARVGLRLGPLPLQGEMALTHAAASLAL